MKCDELKIYVMPLKTNIFGKTTVGQAYYPKSDVDAAIAELKEFAEDACLERDDNQAVIDELNAELESLKATAYTESVDAGMRERRLKRSLWLARANNAESQSWYWCARFGFESGFTKTDICGYSVNTKRRLRTIGEWIEKWKNVKSKCLAKAEEY